MPPGITMSLSTTSNSSSSASSCSAAAGRGHVQDLAARRLQHLARGAGDVGVVLHQQDAQLELLDGTAAGWRQGGVDVGGRMHRREAQHHRGAGAGLALDPRRAAGPRAQAVHLRQAQAGAGAHRLGGEEGLEHPLQVGRCDA
jgi:hypothetical protein